MFNEGRLPAPNRKVDKQFKRLQDDANHYLQKFREKLGTPLVTPELTAGQTVQNNQWFSEVAGQIKFQTERSAEEFRRIRTSYDSILRLSEHQIELTMIEQDQISSTFQDNKRALNCVYNAEQTLDTTLIEASRSSESLSKFFIRSGKKLKIYQNRASNSN